MLKLLVIKSLNVSRWESCKTIVANLTNCYDHLSNNNFYIEYFDWNSNPIDLAQKLHDNHYDKLIFIDHSPSPARILNLLLGHLALNKIPPIIIHSYGDFTYFSNEWLEIESKIIGHEITFLSASEAQTNLVKSFLLNPENSKEAFFPIIDSQLSFDIEARNSVREKYGVSKNEQIYIYSGRISLQKNVDLLIEQFIKSSPPEAKLWIVGAFDDMGAPFMGGRTNEGYLFQKINKIIEKSSKVKLLGFKNKTDLYRLLMASDCFVSLSLYHDEDFGIAPAEALATGLPAYLSDWGGHSSFKNINNFIQLCPVKINENGLNINLKNLFKNVQLKDNLNQRLLRSRDFLLHYSPTSLAEKLKINFSNQPSFFEGFRPTLKNYSHIFHHSNKFLKSIKDSLPPKNEGIYYETYQHYISNQVNEIVEGWKLVDWNLDHFLCIQHEIPFKDNYHVDLIPYSNELFSHDFSTMLLNGKIGIGLNFLVPPNFSECTLRDGLIPLSLFFKSSKNKNLNKFSISSDLTPTIPHEIKHLVSYYQTVPSIQPELFPNKVILSYLFDSITSKIEDVDSVLSKIHNSFKDLSNVEIFLLEISSINPLLQNPELKDYLYSQLTNKFKKFSSINWNEFRTMNTFKEFAFFEINNKMLIAETYSFHQALAKGAQILFEKKIVTPTHSLNLSINHKREFFQENPFSDSSKSSLIESHIEKFLTRYPQWEN